MNREYLFRGIREDNGEWAYGDLITKPIHHECVILSEGVIHYAVKHETVGQYTGFKDRKENPIFDGDIVRLADKYNYIVKWDEGRWVCDHTNEEWGRWGNLYRAFECDFLQKYFVIIGNIHQNPELLKKD